MEVCNATSVGKKAPLVCGNQGPLSQALCWKKTASIFEYFMLVTASVKFCLSSLYPPRIFCVDYIYVL